MNTIRNRLILIFAVNLVFIGGLSILYYRGLFDLKQKVILIERFEDYRVDILELQRYVKKFFMAGEVASMDEIVFYLSKTKEVFTEMAVQIKNTMGAVWHRKSTADLRGYKRLLQDSLAEAKNGSKNDRMDEIRTKGKPLIVFAEELITVERQRIHSTLKRMLLIPVAFGVSLMVVLSIIFRMVNKDILRPLSLMLSAAEKAIEGTFLPIKYSKKRGDEVSQCIAAFNKMAGEIEIRQEQFLHSRKMASIGTFTSGIAHELNNPVNNISLIAESLIEDGEKLFRSDRVALYQDLMDQAERSSDIVKNLLEFSRSHQHNLEEVSLEELVGNTVRLVKNELYMKHIKYDSEVRDKLPKVWLDKSRMQQALLNLLINAIQAMPDGGELKIGLSLAENPDEVRIDVMDTGEGILADDINSIFDPFFSTKKERGTGLGLSVTYSIIQKHGGRLCVESVPDQGTCFAVFLPIKATHESGQSN